MSVDSVDSCSTVTEIEMTSMQEDGYVVVGGGRGVDSNDSDVDRDGDGDGDGWLAASSDAREVQEKLPDDDDTSRTISLSSLPESLGLPAFLLYGSSSVDGAQFETCIDAKLATVALPDAPELSVQASASSAVCACGSMFAIKDGVSQDLEALAPSPHEWEAYVTWLEEVVHATARELHDARIEGVRKVTPQMCVFLEFYRFGIPIEQIAEPFLATRGVWESRRRRCWASAKCFLVPRIPLGGFDGRSDMGNRFSCAWWLRPNAPHIPTNSNFLRRYPIVRLYHRIQTTAIDAGAREADLLSLERVLRSYTADETLQLSSVITKLHPAYNLAKCPSLATIQALRMAAASQGAGADPGVPAADIPNIYCTIL